MDKITQKIVQIKPIDKVKKGVRCKCYNNFRSSDNKPLKLVLDSENRLLYCDHCGNIIDPIIALEMLAKTWETLYEEREYVVKCIRRAWEIGRKYRPWKRSLKDLEKQIGRRGENLPCCPQFSKFISETDLNHWEETAINALISMSGGTKAMIISKSEYEENIDETESIPEDD